MSREERRQVGASRTGSNKQPRKGDQDDDVQLTCKSKQYPSKASQRSKKEVK